MKYLGQTQSGSQADTVASRNRYGQYYRRRATPVNPTTPAQTTVRSRLGLLASQWAGLSAAQRQSWQAWADNHPRTDSLGQSVVLSGIAAFISLNGALQASEFTGVTTPPATEPVWPSLSLGLTMAHTGPAVTATFSGLTAGYAVQVWIGRQQPAGRAFDVDLRLIDTIVISDTSPMLLTSAYTARWGTPIAGAIFHYAFRRIWQDGGIDVFLRNFGTTGA